MTNNTTQDTESSEKVIIPGRENIEDFCSTLAAGITESIAKAPDDFNLHKQILHDLNDRLISTAAEMVERENAAVLTERSELLWSLATNLPEFDTETLYQKRSSLLSIAASVFLGWIVGGVLATVLGIFGLGGDIIRPFTILGAIWLSEYLGGNPRARRMILTIFGLGGLTRFASLVVGGMFRFTGMASLRTAIFGSARAGLAKSLWLFGGAFFVLVFLSKKVSGLDVAAFRQSLRAQCVQKLKLLCFVLTQLLEKDKTLRELYEKEKPDDAKGKCSRDKCQLAGAIMEILNSLDKDKRAYLKSSLEAVGFHPHTENDSDDYLVWDTEEHAPLYDTIGIVRDGDHCRILKTPYVADGQTIKGHVQKINA